LSSNALKTSRLFATDSAGLNSVIPLAPVRKLVSCVVAPPISVR
jgi:hypothetical protein